MKAHIFKLAASLIFVSWFCSCQKEIAIDLNSAEPKIVIEAEVSDQPASCKVKLTRTVNFSQSNNFPAVKGAIVIISDNTGNSETLAETSPGIYTSSTLQGIPGRAYTLVVTDAGKEYRAMSTMSSPVSIDTLTVEKSFFGNQRYINVEFGDPAGTANQYRFIKTINNILEKSIYITNDYLQDGNYFSMPLFSEDSMATGDSVSVLLQSIDMGVYEYFRTLSQLGGGDPSQSPANPLSNFTNGALGYFNAYAVRSKTIIVP